ncbi:MAG: HEAT repeat domain-containing protein [Alphaproteobacteria bacterium]|nr:HEAT repeat domain-containing protein [Alphaproteobacteria bacterium]
MGLFDFWMNEDQKIAKQQRLLTDRNQQAEERDKAARWLVDNGSPKAIVALLTRFDIALENGLKDKAEKETMLELLRSLGDALSRPLERHLERCRHIALPLQLYVDLKGEEAATVKLFEILEIERKKDDFKPEKKVDALVWLAERRHPRAIDATVPMLADFDEGVRYAAAEVIVAQQDDAGREPLLGLLTNPEEDSNRLRTRLAEVFSQRRWAVPDDLPVPVGYAVREGRVVAA